MNRELYKITMEQANGNLMTALENQIQADVGGTREQANLLANHLLDILDSHQEYKDNKPKEFEKFMNSKNKAIINEAFIACKNNTASDEQKLIWSLAHTINVARNWLVKNETDSVYRLLYENDYTTGTD